MKNDPNQQPILRELKDGLILRRSNAEDAEALAEFLGRMHSDDGPESPDAHVAAWTHDLLTKPHPTFRPYDFTIVAEAATGRIVSALCLISQKWTYEGIPFGVGRPELVATLPEYRNRGLIRLQMDEVHKWSAERGELVQAITGIPFYYRLFGYEMALDLAGRRFGYEGTLPKLTNAQKDRFRIRKAATDDLGFVHQVYEHSQKRYAIAGVRGIDILEYELNVQRFENANHYELMIIENEKGTALGYIQHPTFLGFTGLSAVGYELKPGVSWLDVSTRVVHYLWETGQAYGKRDGKQCHAFGFLLGQRHPAYEALGTNILPGSRDPYAYYIRVVDLPAFIRHIAPALQQRLENSIAPGFNGELKLSFFRDGLRLIFESGRLKEAESWRPKPGDEENAAFPGLTFLQLLFGYRSFDELEQSFPDCYWNNWNDRTLINILFPKHLSDVFPVA